MRRGGRPYPQAQRLEARDPAFQPITRLQSLHAGRRAGKHQISLAQRKVSRQLGQYLRHLPDHLADISFLTQLTVHLEPDATVLHMTLGHRSDRSERRGVLESFCRIPGSTAAFGHGLQIPASQIHSYRIAEDVRQRLGEGNVAAAAADGDDHLDLVVQLAGA